jgi:hypothetical protein
MYNGPVNVSNMGDYMSFHVYDNVIRMWHIFTSAPFSNGLVS